MVIKLLAENAVTCSDYAINLVPLDKTKTFDTVNMKIYFEEFYGIIEKGDLYLFISSILKNQPEIKVKIERAMGESFKTLIYTMSESFKTQIRIVQDSFLNVCIKTSPEKLRAKESNGTVL